MYEQWRRAYPELAEELDAGINACSCGVNPADSDKAIPPFPQDYGDATRSAGAVAINAIAKANPCFLTTSADLYSSNKTTFPAQETSLRKPRKGATSGSASANTPWPPSATALPTTACSA